MATIRLPEIDAQGNFISPDVIDRLAERFGTGGGGGSLKTTPAASLTLLPGVLSGQSGYSGRSYTQDSVTTGGGYRFAAWYSETGTLLVGRRPVTQSGAWETFDMATISGNPLVLPVDNDSHNTVSIHLDSSGRLHVAANMHGDQLRYVRANVAWGITSWAAPVMVGTEEDYVTYPRFARTPNGTLFMTYRNGSSGSGDVYLNRYSVNGGTWTRVGRIAQGAAFNESPYETRFVAGPDGSLNLGFTWRPNGGAFDTNNDIHFIRSYDEGATWQAADGTPVTLPLVHSNTTALVLDTADSGSGIANQFGLDVDTDGNPHMAVHLLNGTPHRNIYHLYWNGSAWVTQQATFLVNNNASGTAPARPSIACTNSGRTVIFTKYATGVHKGKPMMVDVTTEPVEAPIADLDLREWELTYDSLALRERDELVLMVSTVNADISSPMADYHSISNWDRQWGGVLILDASQLHIVLRREAPLPFIKLLTTITTPDNVAITTTTDSLVGHRYVTPADLFGRKVMARMTARASATAGQTMTMQIAELEQDGPSRKFAAVPFNTSFTAIKSTPWVPLVYGPINSKSAQVYMVAKVDGGTGTVASSALEIGVIDGPVF